jgi:hypothetical protein
LLDGGASVAGVVASNGISVGISVASSVVVAVGEDDGIHVVGKYVGNVDGFKDGMEVGALVMGTKDGALVVPLIVLLFCINGDDVEMGVAVVGASVAGVVVPRIVGYLVVGGLVADTTGSKREGMDVWGMMVGAGVVRG